MITYLAPGFPVSLFEAMAHLLDAELLVADGMSGPAGDDDPLTDGRADLAWMCSTAYVELAARPGSDVRLAGVAWAPAVTSSATSPGAAGAARPLYYSEVVVSGDSRAAALADLAGRRIGCNDPMSLSGYHALRIALAGRGLAEGPDRVDGWAQLVMTGGHARSVDQLLRGDLDAAVLDSVLLAAWRRQRPDLADLRTVERLGPWPTQPLVAAGRLRTDVVDAVRDRLLAGNGDPALRTELDRIGLLGLVPVGADHCAAVATALTALDRSADQSGAIQSGPK